VPPADPHPDPHHPDPALLHRAQSGDRAALTLLLTAHQDRLYAVCLRMVADRTVAADLTQDTLVKIIQHLPTYDGRSQLTTWMIRIAMNTCLSHLRSQKHRRHTSLDSGPGAATADSDFARSFHPQSPSNREPAGPSGVELHERRGIVSRALAELDPDHRAVLILRDVQGLDYDQIAAAVGVPVGTVKSRIFRARAALRELIERPSSSSPPPNAPRP
jgi:RNA polymerase sigma-70 factor (ECF subfamily)